MEQQCQVAEVSRAGFYRYLQQTRPEQADLLLRARLQELAVAHHRLRGYRMLTALLRREGRLVNHKRVLRLMREDNLLSLRRKKFVFTTDSAHTLPIYPNLARYANLTGLNQLWVADITFIRLRSEFIYLAVVLDAYSRRVVGWDLGRTLHAELAIRALRMALNARSWKAEGLIHHSDRGVQYASSDYTDLLEQGEIQISMSRRGNPYDNARASQSSSRPARPAEVTALMEAVENQKQVYHRSHRPWKSILDSHTPAARRLLMDKTKPKQADVSPVNCLQACLSLEVQSI